MTTDADRAAADYDDLHWIGCWKCHGEGDLEDCFEDICVCLNPPCCWTRCDVCEGKGGWRDPEASEE